MPQGGQQQPARRRRGVQPGEMLLTNQPYIFSSQMATFGTTEINGGALAAGISRPFPQNDLVNAIGKPYIAVRLKFSVLRVAGGNEVDFDYDCVLAMVSGVSFDMKFMRNPVPLSVLCDKQRREWLLQPGKIPFSRLGGGINIEMSVQPGALGAPFNLSVAGHGVLQAYVPTDEGDLPVESGY